VLLTRVFFIGAAENPKICVALPRQNAHLLSVNDPFASVASFDF
jgi:hypothetical protein